MSDAPHHDGRRPTIHAFAACAGGRGGWRAGACPRACEQEACHDELRPEACRTPRPSV